MRAGRLRSGQAPQLANNGEGLRISCCLRIHHTGLSPASSPATRKQCPRNPRRAVGRLVNPACEAGNSSVEGFVREVAAFVLDHGGFSGVPPTALVTGRHAAFNNGRQRHADSDSRPLAKLKHFNSL